MSDFLLVIEMFSVQQSGRIGVWENCLTLYDFFRDAEGLNTVKFQGVKLRRANLANHDLRKQDFTNVDLSEANLCDTKLDGAVFKNANLSGVQFDGASLIGVNWAGARNIDRKNISMGTGPSGEECKHLPLVLSARKTSIHRPSGSMWKMLKAVVKNMCGGGGDTLGDTDDEDSSEDSSDDNDSDDDNEDDGDDSEQTTVIEKVCVS